MAIFRGLRRTKKAAPVAEVVEKKPVTLAERHYEMTKARDACVKVFEVLDPNDEMDRALAQIISQAQANLSARIMHELRIGDMARQEVGAGPKEEPVKSAEI